MDCILLRSRPFRALIPTPHWPRLPPSRSPSSLTLTALPTSRFLNHSTQPRPTSPSRTPAPNQLSLYTLSPRVQHHVPQPLSRSEKVRDNALTSTTPSLPHFRQQDEDGCQVGKVPQQSEDVHHCWEGFERGRKWHFPYRTRFERGTGELGTG